MRVFSLIICVLMIFGLSASISASSVEDSMMKILSSQAQPTLFQAGVSAKITFYQQSGCAGTALGPLVIQADMCTTNTQLPNNAVKLSSCSNGQLSFTAYNDTQCQIGNPPFTLRADGSCQNFGSTSVKIECVAPSAGSVFITLWNSNTQCGGASAPASEVPINQCLNAGMFNIKFLSCSDQRAKTQLFTDQACTNAAASAMDWVADNSCQPYAGFSFKARCSAGWIDAMPSMAMIATMTVMVSMLGFML